MKFDYDRAWRDAVGLMADNRTLLAGIAGIFFFVAYVALLLSLPLIATMPAADADFATVMAAMEKVSEEARWAFILVAISIVYGTLAMLALLKLRSRPTVGEALTIAGAALVFYLIAFFIQLIAIQLVIVIIATVVGVLGLAALEAVALGLAIYLIIYLMVRFSMTAPVMVIEGVRNPFRALRQSWSMTQGNGGRITGFYLLIFLAFMVVSMVSAMIGGALLAMAGEATARFGDAIISGVILSAAYTLLACILAASYAQLSRRRESAA